MSFCHNFTLADPDSPTGGPTLPSLPLTYPPFPFLSPSLPLRPPFLYLPLEVGPLNTARGLGECCKLPQWDLGRAPAEIELVHFALKIWRRVVPILLIFLRINNCYASILFSAKTKGAMVGLGEPWPDWPPGSATVISSDTDQFSNFIHWCTLQEIFSKGSLSSEYPISLQMCRHAMYTAHTHKHITF